MDEIIQFLRSHPFFAGLDSAQLEQIARLVISRKVTRNQQFLFEGDPPQAVYFIVHGRMRIYRVSPSGREQALMDVFPGQVFNLVPILDGRPVVSNAVARTNGLLYAFTREDFLHLIRTYTSVAEAVLIDFSGRLRHLTGLVEDLSLRTVPERLARLLLNMADEKTPAPPRFTQQELATQLGTVREVISRTLKSFEHDGLIHVDRHRVVILDQPRLLAIARQLS